MTEERIKQAVKQPELFHRTVSSSELNAMHTTAAAITTTDCINLMDLRGSGILDNRISAEENEGHLDERFEAINDEAEATSSDESEDPEFRELEERSQIVEKYERGPEQEVEEWENPDLELYKVTDRYGFMHKDVQEICMYESAEKKRMVKEVSREQKWLRMMSRWNDGKGANDKLKKRLWKGVPEKFRSLVWARLLEISRYQQEQKSNVYRELLMRARLISKDIKQIDLDINRTYRDHLAFRRRYDVKQQSLFNVLSAYAMYNTEVGYCQGMSQIAALFLMYMDEEDAFWCLHALLVDKKHSMHGFFVPGFPKLIRFQVHYEKILQKYLPRLKKHLDKAGIPSIYVTKWWFGCFLDRVPFPLALRLWDVFLLEGDVILIAMAYNIMKMHEKTMRKLQMENFMEYIQTVIAQDFGFSDEETMKSLQDCLRKLHNDHMLLPSSPKPGDAPEIPMKPFGPVLSRSMIDIRLDIAEIQSRCSRANSVAGRSPVGMRRTRLPPSPTLLSKYKLSQLSPRQMEATVTENSHSSISSTSTLRDTHARDQTTKVFTTKNGNLLSPRLESSESFSQLPQHQSTPVMTKWIEVKTVRPVIIEEAHLDIRMNERNSSPFYGSSLTHSDSKEGITPRAQELQPQQQQKQSSKRPTTEWHIPHSVDVPENSLSNNTSTSSRYLGMIGMHEIKNICQQPPKEPPVDYDDFSAYYVQRRPSSSSVHPTVPTVGSQFSPAYITPPFFCDPGHVVIPRSNEIVADDYASGLVKSDHSDFTFRNHSNDVDVTQPISQCAKRGSFYDNVPSSIPNRSSSNGASQAEFISGEGCINGGVIFGVHAENSSLRRRHKHTVDNSIQKESNQEKLITKIETRVLQLPNNVTCVRVDDSVESTPSPCRQQQFYDVPVRRGVCDTRITAGSSEYAVHGSSTMDNRLHYHHRHPSNPVSEYVQHHESHFPTKSNQSETVQYEQNTYGTNKRLSSARPLRFRPDQY